MNTEMLAAFESAKNEIQRILEDCEKTRGKKFRVYVELMQTLTLLFQSGGVETGILTAKTAEVCGSISEELGLSEEDCREALNIVRSLEKIGKELGDKLSLARADDVSNLN